MARDGHLGTSWSPSSARSQQSRQSPAKRAIGNLERLCACGIPPQLPVAAAAAGVAEGFAVGVGRFVRLRRLRPLALNHALPSPEQGSSSAHLPAGCTALPWALAPSATGGSTSHPAWATTTHFSGPQLHVWRPPHCPVGVREVPARPLRCCVAAAGLLGGRWGRALRHPRAAILTLRHEPTNGSLLRPSWRSQTRTPPALSSPSTRAHSFPSLSRLSFTFPTVHISFPSLRALAVPPVIVRRGHGPAVAFPAHPDDTPPFSPL